MLIIISRKSPTEIFTQKAKQKSDSKAFSFSHTWVRTNIGALMGTFSLQLQKPELWTESRIVSHQIEKFIRLERTLLGAYLV